jgi:DNA-binding response OmpR family regulator
MAKVLIIDDDAAMRRMMSRVLTDARHQVIEASDGLDGVRKFRAEAPEIIVTDIVMPEQEGIQTIREIRADGSAVVIIAISGGGGGGDGSLYLTIAEELGADAVLQKPFRLAELVAVVDRMLAREPPGR